MPSGSVYNPGAHIIGRGLHRPGANRIGGSPGVLGKAGVSAALPGLPIYAAAQQLRSGGTRNAKVLIVGDSTTAGWGGLGTSAHTNDASFSWPTALASLVPSGIAQSFFGDYNTLSGAGGTIGIGTFDSRISLGSWVQTQYPGANTTQTVGGNMLRCTAGTTPLAFTPSVQVDTFDIYYIVGSNLGAMTAAIDAGGTTAINETGTSSLQKLTLSTTLGTHTLNLARVSGTVFVVGVIAYNSAQKSTVVINGGFSGSGVTDWVQANGAWDPTQVIPFISPDLTIICLTINDWINATNTTTYSNNLQTLINTAKITGDVILMSAPASQITSATQAQQDTYTAIVRSLATSNSLRFLSMTSSLGDWATNNALSRMFDALHPNGTYYSLEAAALNATLANPGSPATSSVKTVSLTTTGAGTWTVPADFTSLVSVETIAGGGGSNGLSAGGGGGAYAKITSTSTTLTPGVTSISIGVGAGGNTAAGGDTWWNATSLANAVSNGSGISVAAQGGQTNATTTGGSGGLAASSVGTTKFSGGTGGNTNSQVGGGGGAAGPLGNGGNGGAGGTTGQGAGGGGGNGGGTAGIASSGTSGGNGGNNAAGTGHGVGSTTVGTNGASGGGGGAGGASFGGGGTGGNGTEWATVGSGGGGGGGVGTAAGTGNGGLYGGGGGGRNNALGGQGIIVIKYNGSFS